MLCRVCPTNLREEAPGLDPGAVHTSGLAFSQTGSHSDKRIRQRVDLLKIMATDGVLSEKDDPRHSHFTDAEIRAFVEETDRVDIPVAAHAQGTAGITDALWNGVDTIGHGIHLDGAAIGLRLDRDAVLVPTLAVLTRFHEHGENAMELKLYVEEIGMDPVEALHTATGAAAEALLDDDVGTLTPGNHADIVALSTDPRADFATLRDDVDAVYKDGRAVS